MSKFSKTNESIFISKSEFKKNWRNNKHIIYLLHQLYPCKNSYIFEITYFVELKSNFKHDISSPTFTISTNLQLKRAS